MNISRYNKSQNIASVTIKIQIIDYSRQKVGVAIINARAQTTVSMATVPAPNSNHAHRDLLIPPVCVVVEMPKMFVRVNFRKICRLLRVLLSLFDGEKSRPCYSSWLLNVNLVLNNDLIVCKKLILQIFTQVVFRARSSVSQYSLFL